MDAIPSPANLTEALAMRRAASVYLAANAAAMTPEQWAEYLELLDQSRTVAAAWRAALLQKIAAP
jgi:uncharacterized protein (DUF1778 family)